MARLVTVVRRVFIGRPVSTHAELRHRVPKRIALAVFSSDALSSSAYATDVMLVALAGAGSAALSKSIPIAIAVCFVLSVVVISYRTTVKAYPRGGGGYAVASENLGFWPGAIVASSLLIDYVLTVAVSVAAGVKAISAAVPGLHDHRVALALAVVMVMTLGNLRGLKESGTIFAIPTYGFLISMGALIVAGLFQRAGGGFTPIGHPEIEATTGLTLFLILRAFAQGSTALTGVEAIANAVPAFRPPESRNAAQTLVVLGVLLTFLFFGITFLAHAFGVDPIAVEEQGRPVTSQLAGAIFGAGSFMFYAIQLFTALILFLAANTSYTGFPALSSVLARDRLLPRVFQNRGDRLAFSNGIVILAVTASGVLIAYGADELKIIPLYVIGVFTNFTLAQAGLVRRWLRIRGDNWKRSAALNAFGAVTTGVVLTIVSVTKFSGSPEERFDGAWQVILLIPVLAWLLYRVKGHYDRVGEELRMEHTVPRIYANRAVVLVSAHFGATVKALAFTRAFDPEELRVVAFRVAERKLREIRRRWHEMGIPHTIEPTGHEIEDLVEFVRGLNPSESEPVTVVIPDPQSANAFRQVLEGRLLLRIKGALLYEPGVVVVSVPFRPGEDPEPDRLRAPARFSIIVVVSAMHRATVRALEYAKSLHPAELKAVNVAIEPEEAGQLLREWARWGIDLPLEIVDSPYRSIVQPLIKELRDLGPNPYDVVGVVVPEFVLGKWWQHLLHGQTALLIKTALLFEPNIFVIDVPYRIRRSDTRLPR